MDWRVLAGLIVGLIAACVVLFVLLTAETRENAELKTALASQGAVLAETQKELALRDNAIKKRDADIAALERKSEAQGRKYARLLREKKDVRDWADTPLPADVRGLLNAGADGADRSAGRSDGGSVDP